MDAIQGKLGSDDSAVESVKDTEKKDTSWMEEIVNTLVIPKLQNYGLDIPVGESFCFLNDKEKAEAAKKKDEEILRIADIAYKFSQAGLEVTPEWIEERTGIKVTKKEVEQFGGPGLTPEKKEALNKMYGVK